MRVRSRALDGGLLDVEAEGVIGPISTHVVARSAIRRVSAFYISSGPRGHGESAALDPELGRQTELAHEVELHGGRLRIWSGLQPIGPDGQEYAELTASGSPQQSPVHFAAWTAEAFELCAVRYSQTAEDLLALFGDFALSSTPEGLVCTPVDTTVFWFSEPPSVILDLPDVGVLEVFEIAGSRARMLPRHPGTPVDGGELYIRNEAAEVPYLVHTAESAVSYLSPYDHHNLQPAVDFLATMRAVWRA